MDTSYLDQLNPQQRAAVEYLGGPELVIAGAGSGKTRVLTYKIVHLLANGFEPWRIMALTFTNKAAREMRQRIEGLIGSQYSSRLWMGTFHSIFARILRLNAERIGFKSSFTIYDAADSKALIKSIIKTLDLDDTIYKPATVAAAISNAKNALLSPEAYAEDRDIMEADRRARRPRMAEIYMAYRNRCFSAGAMDFDDLLYYANVLLRDNSDIRRHYQEYFRYILVDEYQDTNFAQHVIVSQLIGADQNLCVVGDDAQSIYSFRGANIRNILHLNRAYPRLATFKLEQNYRSTKTIIGAANSLIDKNRDQIRKHVFSEGDQGMPIEVVRSYSDYEESHIVAARISQRKMETHDSYEEFAVLYRTNAQSRVLEESLRKRNIPYRIYGGLSFYQRKEVKDAVAYFRLAVNPDDDEALRRVINFPARGIGETTINKLLRCATIGRVSIWTVINNPAAYNLDVNRGTLGKLNAFASLIAGFNQLNASGADASEMARNIIARTGLLTMLLSDRTPESISKQENLNELMAAAATMVEEAKEEGDEVPTLTRFLADVSLATDQDVKDRQEGDGETERVTLMTVHAAKGLEFSNVFIVGVEEDLFPSHMSQTPQEVEEERRLLYVAITRAKRFCMMSYAGSRFRNGQTMACRPSRFIADIDSSYMRMTSPLDGDNSSSANPMEQYRASYHSDSRYPWKSSSQGPSRPWRPAAEPSSSLFTPAASPMPKTPAAPAGPGGTHAIHELAPGMNITHSRFGDGIIDAIDTSGTDPRIIVDFSNVGRKTLLLKFARFTINN